MGTGSIRPPGNGGIPPRIQGEAGASAQRVGEGRRSARERRAHERYPRLGGALLALRGEPAHERAWGAGAEGERIVAAALAKRCNENVFLCHDRRLPRGGNVDHLAIAPSGIWVIDSKRYSGRVRIEARLFGEDRLRIGGRDRTKLLDGLDRQVAVVADTLAGFAADVPVHGALCFVGADMLRARELRGHELLTARRLSKRLNATGRLPLERLELLAEQLAERFPPA